MSMPAAAAPRRRSLLAHPAVRIAIWALLFRAFSALVALLLNIVFPDYQRAPFTVFGSTSPFWDAFARWDSGWYYQIAERGYSYTPGGRDTIAWFPVYPMLMRHVGRLFGPGRSHIYMGGVAVSWIAFAIAMAGLYYLARLDLPARRAARASVAAAVFPFAFFFGAVYSEAVFLAAAIGAFYGFRTRRYIAGGLCGAVVTATRVNGIFILPALAWIVWRQLRSTERPVQASASPAQAWWRPAVGLLLVPLGIVSYSLFVYQLSGNPLEWAAAIQRWDYHPGGNPAFALLRLARELIVRPYAFLAGGGMAPYDALNGTAAIVFLISLPFVWMRLGAAYGIYMAANLWLPLSSGQYEGLGRYCAVMFPFFIWVAAITTRAGFTIVVIASAMLYTLCMGLFTNVHPLF